MRNFGRGSQEAFCPEMRTAKTHLFFLGIVVRRTAAGMKNFAANRYIIEHDNPADLKCFAGNFLNRYKVGAVRDNA